MKSTSLSKTIQQHKTSSAIPERRANPNTSTTCSALYQPTAAQTSSRRSNYTDVLLLPLQLSFDIDLQQHVGQDQDESVKNGIRDNFMKRQILIRTPTQDFRWEVGGRNGLSG